MNDIIGIIIGIGGALVGFIFYLLKINKEAKMENASLKTESATKEAITKADIQEEKANEIQKDYESVRDKFLSDHPDSDSTK